MYSYQKENALKDLVACPHWQWGPHLATSGVGGWRMVVPEVTEEINIGAP